MLRHENCAAPKPGGAGRRPDPAVSPWSIFDRQKDCVRGSERAEKRFPRKRLGRFRSFNPGKPVWKIGETDLQ